jgi:CHAT domain-containing protein
MHRTRRLRTPRSIRHISRLLFLVTALWVGSRPEAQAASKCRPGLDAATDSICPKCRTQAIITLDGFATNKDSKLLEPGRPIDERLAGSHCHIYRVTLAKGEFLHVALEQDGINVILTLSARPPDGTELVRANLTLQHIAGRESASYEATEAGLYQVTVRSVNSEARSGAYHMVIHIHQRATDEDKQRIRAEQLTREAIYSDTPQQAIENGKEAVKLWQAMGECYWEAYTLNGIGKDYRSLDRNDEAIEYHNRALSIYRETKNRVGEAESLANIGSANLLLSHFTEAIDCYERALQIYKEQRIRQGEAIVLVTLGDVYLLLNDPGAVVKYYEEALRLFRMDRDRFYEGTVLGNIGNFYITRQRYDKAIAYWTRAFKLYHKFGNRLGKGIALNNLGVAYSSLKQFTKATEYLKRAASVYQIENNRNGEGLVLRDIGRAYFSQGLYEEATQYFHQALNVFLEVRIENPYSEGEILKDLMLAYKAQGKPDLAILYGKQSVNLVQQMRRNITSLRRELQKSFLESKEDVYRELVQLLMSQGRLLEAEQTLKMLKGEEYFQYIRRSESTSSEEVAFNPTEERVRECYRKNSDGRISIASERSKLDKDKRELEKRFQGSNEEQEKEVLEKELDRQKSELEGLEKKLSEAAESFRQCRASLDRKAGQGPVPPEVEEWLEGLKREDTLKNLLGGMESNTQQKQVAICTFLGKERIQFIVFTAEAPPVLRESPNIKRDDLYRMVSEFREEIVGKRSDPRRLALELYKVLVEPIARDLEASGARTILWSLDGVLRYLPMAALYDGEHYLVETYQNVMITLASLEGMETLTSKDWEALGLGVTERHDPFKALPRAETEIRGIINELATDTAGVLPGKIYLNDKFNAERLRDMREHKVVHIASHFKLEPGDETQSFLLLGDGSHLTVEQIRTMNFGGEELLTLSACETAIGSDTGSKGEGKEVESFAMIAKEKGAKAVLATLWEIDDESTSTLMREFYRNKVALGRRKAEALQMAQKALLADPRYAHPYYWAPFILIGNMY